MSTPPNVTNITTGNIENVENAAVAVGPDAVAINNSPGAVINKIQGNILPTARPAPILDLPSQPEEFLGRRNELSALQAASQASRKVSLWATNGMGKTALASRLMYSFNEADASKSIAYLDALGLHGDDLALALYDKFFQRPALYIPSRSSMSSDLQKVQALVFIDNLDLSNNNVASLINTAPRCSFVLISTERALNEGKSVRLQGLPNADAIALFEEKFGRPLGDVEKGAVTRICELLGGCPDEIIRAALRGCEDGKTPAELLAELSASGADNKSLAAAATADLNETDRKVLAALAAAGAAAVPIALLQALMPGVDVPAELDRLKSLNLIQSHSPRYTLCGTLPSGLAAAWDLTSSRDTLLETSINWLSQQGPSEAVRDSISMMLNVLGDAAASQRWPDVVRLGRVLERFAFYYTRWQAWADVLNILLRAAKATANAALEGWALHQLGSHALLNGMLDMARTHLNQALKIRESIKDREGIEVTRHNLRMLKEVGASMRGKGGSGGHSLTYGFFGFAGLVVIALAGYALFRPRPAPPATPLVAPILSTTPAPPPAISTPTETPTSTPTSVPTDTPTVTPTETPTPGPFGAAVISDAVACRYGPGKPYTYEWTFSLGDQVEVLGRQDTAFGPWVYVKYTPPPGYKGPKLPCWVNPQYLKMDGDISILPADLYPDKAPLIIWNDPKYVPQRFPPPTNVEVGRVGNVVDVSWTGKNLAPGDRQCDRVSPGCALFLAEFWTCQSGQIVFTPQSIYFEYDPSQPIASVSTEIQDDAGCSTASYGRIYVAHSDGYIGPANVFIVP